MRQDTIMTLNKIIQWGCAIIFLAEFNSAFIFSLMGLPNLPLPWSWLVVLQQGFITPVLIAFGVTIVLVSIIICYYKKGFYRYLALLQLTGTILILLALSIGLVIFHYWAGVTPIPTIWTLWLLINSLPDSVMLHKLMICLVVPIVILALATAIYWIVQGSDERNALGDAHFASPLEIKKAGFFEETGIILGTAWGKILRSQGFEHVLAFSPTGSGKTTAIADPNLFTWPYSCVANDAKYELFEKTSGYRARHFNNAVFEFAPTRKDGKTHRYNPLTFISDHVHKRISDIQLLAHSLIPNGQGEPIWTQSSRELFLALTLYLLDTPEKNTTLGEMYNLSKQHQFNKWLKKLVEKTDHLDAEFYRNASSYLNTAEKTRASILKTFTGYLEIFANPIINAATSASDFDLRDLRKRRITIYIGFPDNEREMIAPILTIFWQQLISFMTEKIPDEKEEPYPLLCLMDEFSTLGRLVNLKNSLKLLRGYRVRVVIIIQYLAQTLELYSKAEAEAFKNIKTKISYALDSQEDAEFVSRLLGTKTKRVRNHSHTSHQQGGSHSTSDQAQGVPLMRPSQIQRMGHNQVLIMRTGHAPVKAKKCFWYKEKTLKNCPCGQIEVPTQTPIILPFERDGISLEKSREEKESLTHQRDLEKITAQAGVLGKALVKAVNHINTSNKEGHNNESN